MLDHCAHFVEQKAYNLLRAGDSFDLACQSCFSADIFSNISCRYHLQQLLFNLQKLSQFLPHLLPSLLLWRFLGNSVHLLKNPGLGLNLNVKRLLNLLQVPLEANPVQLHQQRQQIQVSQYKFILQLPAATQSTLSVLEPTQTLSMPATTPPRTATTPTRSPKKKSEKQIQIDQSKAAKSISQLPPSHFLQQEHFDDSVRFFSTPQFESVQFGPQRVPNNFQFEKESFLLFFQDVLNHLLEKTNHRMREQSIALNKGQKVLQITMQQLVNYWCLFFAMGIVRLSNKRWYWTQQDATDGLLGVKFFKETMGYRMWCAIDRCIQADLSTVSTMINRHIKILWTPFPGLNVNYSNSLSDIAIDDDLDSWKGKGGRKKHINKKADGTGQANWKIVDSSRYCYHMFYEVDLVRSANDPPVAEFYLKELEKQLPPGRIFICWIHL